MYTVHKLAVYQNISFFIHVSSFSLLRPEADIWACLICANLFLHLMAFLRLMIFFSHCTVLRISTWKLVVFILHTERIFLSHWIIWIVFFLCFCFISKGGSESGAEAAGWLPRRKEEKSSDSKHNILHNNRCVPQNGEESEKFGARRR